MVLVFIDQLCLVLLLLNYFFGLRLVGEFDPVQLSLQLFQQNWVERGVIEVFLQDS